MGYVNRSHYVSSYPKVPIVDMADERRIFRTLSLGLPVLGCRVCAVRECVFVFRTVRFEIAAFASMNVSGNHSHSQRNRKMTSLHLHVQCIKIRYSWRNNKTADRESESKHINGREITAIFSSASLLFSSINSNLNLRDMGRFCVYVLPGDMNFIKNYWQWLVTVVAGRSSTTGMK